MVGCDGGWRTVTGLGDEACNGAETPNVWAGGEPRYEIVEFMNAVSSADMGPVLGVMGLWISPPRNEAELGLRLDTGAMGGDLRDRERLVGEGLLGYLKSNMSSHPDLSSTM